MKILNVSDYSLHHLNDTKLTVDDAFNVMENLYLKEGYTIFYTTTGERNPDHHACYEAMKRMYEKYPNLKYRQFPIYYYFLARDVTHPIEPLSNDYVDIQFNKYNSMKKEMFQVYYNIGTILPVSYPYSDGELSKGLERIYFIN
jgi:hypothetical protein